MTLKHLVTSSALVLALSYGGTALAQPSAADVGSFLRDQSGAVIGSLHAVHGDQAVVWYGFFTTPGNHLGTVPLSAIKTEGNHLVLDTAPEPAMASR